MILFILTGVTGLGCMIYGFATVDGVVEKKIDTGWQKTDTTIVEEQVTPSTVEKNITKYTEYKSETGFEKSYTTEWDIAYFIEALQNKDPKVQTDAFIVFGMMSFIFSIFLSVGFGLMSKGNYGLGITFVGTMFFVIYVVAREFISRM